jgi:hypothetical protein
VPDELSGGAWVASPSGSRIYVHLHEVVLASKDLPDRLSVIPDEGWAADDPGWDTRGAIARYIRGFAPTELNLGQSPSAASDDLELITSTAVLFRDVGSCAPYVDQQRRGVAGATAITIDLDGDAVLLLQSVLEGEGHSATRRLALATQHSLVHELTWMTNRRDADQEVFVGWVRRQLSHGRAALHGE